MIARRRRGEAGLQARLARAFVEGELAPETDVVVLARYFVTVLRGLGISATGGASREELLDVARLTLQNWPGRPSAAAFPPFTD